MNAKFGIPAVLLSTTAVGCADPLVGTWSAESVTVDEETITLPYEYEGTVIVESIEMGIDAEMTGTWTQTGYGGSYTMDLEATNNGGGSYTITSSQEEMDDLNCTMTGSELSCSADDATIKFNKGAAKE